jgi:hypothetical protein
VIRDMRVFGINADSYNGGGYGDAGSGGTYIASEWASTGCSIVGTNGSTTRIYGKGIEVATDVLGGNMITSLESLRLFRAAAGATYQCVVNTIVQEVIMFNRVLSAAEHLLLHEKGIGAT